MHSPCPINGSELLYRRHILPRIVKGENMSRQIDVTRKTAIDVALATFGRALLHREIWVGSAPPKPIVGKKPPLAAADLTAIISDISSPLVSVYFPIAIKARQQLANIERLIRRLVADNHIGFIVFDNVSYVDDNFTFHYIVYGEILGCGSDENV
jgi:hypothetical protein